PTTTERRLHRTTASPRATRGTKGTTGTSMAAGRGKPPMRYWTLAVATTVAVALPATAEARSRAMGKHYKCDYHAGATKFGKRAPGRNTVRWGLSNGHRDSKADVRRSIGVLERMLHPAPVVHSVAPKVTQTSPYRAPAPAPAAPAPAPAPAAP